MQLKHFLCMISIYSYLTDFLKTNPTKLICSHLREKASNGRFLKPDKLQNHSNEGKGKNEMKKSNGCTLSFFNSHFGDSFWSKKLLDAEGPFGHNVFKTPARYNHGFITN